MNKTKQKFYEKFCKRKIFPKLTFISDSEMEIPDHSDMIVHAYTVLLSSKSRSMLDSLVLNQFFAIITFWMD